MKRTREEGLFFYASSEFLSMKVKYVRKLSKEEWLSAVCAKVFDAEKTPSIPHMVLYLLYEGGSAGDYLESIMGPTQPEEFSGTDILEILIYLRRQYILSWIAKYKTNPVWVFK